LETVKNGPLGLGLLTPLLGAVPQGNYETVALLVNAGANVNAKDVRGMTSLAMAVSSDRPDPRIVRLLLAKGADPSLKSKNGETAVDWANKYQNPEVLDALGARRKTAAAIPGAFAPVKNPTISRCAGEGVAQLQKSSADSGYGQVDRHAQNLTSWAVQTARANGQVDLVMETGQAQLAASLVGARRKLPVGESLGRRGWVFRVSNGRRRHPPARKWTHRVSHRCRTARRRLADYGTDPPATPGRKFRAHPMGIRSLALFHSGRKTEFDDRIAGPQHGYGTPARDRPTT
jgi:hypothetical protein